MGGGGLFGAPATPADTRPPEERFQTQLQVRIRWDGQTVDSRSVSPAAIDRYGFLQRRAEHPCPPGDGWKCPCCHRVHSQRWRLVSLPFMNTGSTTSQKHVSSLRTISCTSPPSPFVWFRSMHMIQMHSPYPEFRTLIHVHWVTVFSCCTGGRSCPLEVVTLLHRDRQPPTTTSTGSLRRSIFPLFVTLSLQYWDGYGT